MPVVTWIYRILDESNVWLKATKMENMGKSTEAIIFYLQDASESLRIGSLPRAGLSCSCAAECLSKLGADSLAKKLYLKAARIYSENSGSQASRSVREWLWSLQKASENYSLAGETAAAEAAYAEFVVLAKRVDPLIREVEHQPPKSSSKPTGRVLEFTDIPEKILAAVNAFVDQDITLGPSGGGGQPNARGGLEGR